MKDSTLAVVIFGLVGLLLIIVLVAGNFVPGVTFWPPESPEKVERTDLCQLLEWYNMIPGYNVCEIDYSGSWTCNESEISCKSTQIPIDCSHPAADVFFDQCVTVGAGAGCNAHQIYCEYNE